MQTIRIYGHSDDIVVVECAAGADEYGEKDVIDIGGQMLVACKYSPGRSGCWCFAPCQAEDGIPLPDWPIRVSSYKSGYSTLLEIDAPDDAIISVLPRPKQN